MTTSLYMMPSHVSWRPCLYYVPECSCADVPSNLGRCAICIGPEMSHGNGIIPVWVACKCSNSTMVESDRQHSLFIRGVHRR